MSKIEDMKCDKCGAQATTLETDTSGKINYYCDKHMSPWEID